MSKKRLTEGDWALVPLVLASQKSLGASMADVATAIRTRRKQERGSPGDWVFEHRVQVHSRNIHLRLRLCIPYRSDEPVAWRSSLLVFNQKIDGIDFHITAPDGHGGKCRGWHRHIWEPTERTCEPFRTELPLFDPGDTIEMFVIACCAVMRIAERSAGTS